MGAMASHGRCIKLLEERLGSGAVFSDPASLLLYSRDASRLAGACFAVVRASSEGQVATLLQMASREGFAVVPRGAGSSSTGSALPLGGAVVLDLCPLNRILDIDPRDQVAEVEPGVLTGDLQSAAEGHGLFYPPDPASSRFCTIGGNVATCAGGLRALKYGVTRDYVLGIRGVRANGTLLATGGRSLKDVMGYDITRLLVGSEGTLLVFTRITLRLLPLPPARATLLASFDDEVGALDGADRLLQGGLLPRAMEYLDREVLGIVAAHLGCPFPKRVGSQLLLEFDGGRAQVAEDCERSLALLRELGCLAIEQAQEGAARDRLWEARRSISAAVYKITPAKKSEDLGLPRGCLKEALAAVKEAGRRHAIRVLAYGHAGDANLHCNFLYDPQKPGESKRLDAAIRDARQEVLARGGTLSGEHGVGLTRVAALEETSARELFSIYRGIKQVFDPQGILNPGKILSREENRVGT